MEDNTPPVAGQNNWAPPGGAGSNTWAPPAGADSGNWAPPAKPGSNTWAPPGAATGTTGAMSAPAPAPTIIDTSSGKKDGLNRCPKCGSTDISTQPGTGQLFCNFCRATFSLGEVEGVADASKLVGIQIGSGAANIAQSDNTQVTLKCQACGAEVVIDVNEAMTARCHWCRQVLSIEKQIPNGAVPDLVLPFLLSKQQARANIEEFVKKRTFFAHPRFKREFTTENIIGVYLPYLVVDVNIHSDLRGEAGHVVRSYQVGSGKSKTTVYDIDIYNIGRDFDLLIDDLTIEASSEKRNVNAKNNTNNIINTILPFDVQNAVPYNGNYLKGFNSERRDTNIDEVKGLINAQTTDIARFQANSTATAYTAGIRWTQENSELKGMLIKAAYLPVWLYSYYEVKSTTERFLHYVAVNARTGETMGSVPMNMARLVVVSALVEVAALIVTGGLLLLMAL